MTKVTQAKCITALRSAGLALIAGCFLFAQNGGGPNRDSGVVTLDKDGRASAPFERGYLENHFCVVADGWDEVTIGFSAKGFTVSEGQPGQEIDWACVVMH